MIDLFIATKDSSVTKLFPIPFPPRYSKFVPVRQKVQELGKIVISKNKCRKFASTNFIIINYRLSNNQHSFSDYSVSVPLYIASCGPLIVIIINLNLNLLD